MSEAMIFPHSSDLPEESYCNTFLHLILFILTCLFCFCSALTSNKYYLLIY